MLTKYPSFVYLIALAFDIKSGEMLKEVFKELKLEDEK